MSAIVPTNEIASAGPLVLYDPPPDLSIEVVVTSTVLERLPVYARLGVAELWRHVDTVRSAHVR